MSAWLEAVDEAIRGTPPHIGDDDETTRPEGSTLVAWIVIAEWITPDDGRYMQRFGPEGQSRTMGTGLLREGLDT